jgi:glycosyltransferase involved in cell wall biosynthesis
LDKQLHIVCLDVPFPANYGGAIDAFYLMKALHAQGVHITLHCFEYGSRSKQVELEKYCKHVYYYKRKAYWQFIFSKTPFIIASRKNNELLKNLLLDDSPILFEAIHTSGFINHPALQHRKKIVRTLNVESDYYTQLVEHATSFLQKQYYQIEAKRLLQYEQTQLKNTSIACIAQHDQIYFQKYYAIEACKYVGAFHPFKNVNILTGQGEYCLYHGNLGVAENNTSAMWLVENIFNQCKIPLIIAGANPSEELQQAVKQYAHISIIASPDKNKMSDLISNAQIHVLPSFQDTGLKLKLLHALFAGRHCIVNELMLTGTNLQPACTVANTNEEWIVAIEKLFTSPFTNTDIGDRKAILENQFSVQKNGKDLVEIVFGG